MGERFDRVAYDAAHALVAEPNHVAVSLIAVGEAFVSMARGTAAGPDGPPSPADRLGRMVGDGRLDVCWGAHHRPGTSVLALAQEVQRRVPGIGPADYLIVATALACRSCRALYTTDRDLLVSPALRGFCSTGGRQLRISEAPPPARGRR